MTGPDWTEAVFEPVYVDPPKVNGIVWAAPQAHTATPVECFEMTRELLAMRCAKHPDAAVLTMHHEMFLTPLSGLVGELLVGVALMRDLEFRIAAVGSGSATVSSWVIDGAPEGSDLADAPGRLRDELVSRLSAAVADGSASTLAAHEEDFGHKLSLIVALSRDAAEVDSLLASVHAPVQDRGLFVLECVAGLIADVFPDAPVAEPELVGSLGFPYGLADVPRRLLIALPAGSPYLPRTA